jgi:hypothetical protein
MQELECPKSLQRWSGEAIKVGFSWDLGLKTGSRNLGSAERLAASKAGLQKRKTGLTINCKRRDRWLEG